MTEAKSVNYLEQADKLLEQIPNDHRIGDKWNEIQKDLRELEYAEDAQKTVKDLLPKLQTYLKGLQA